MVYNKRTCFQKKQKNSNQSLILQGVHVNVDLMDAIVQDAHAVKMEFVTVMVNHINVHVVVMELMELVPIVVCQDMDTTCMAMELEVM